MSLLNLGFMEEAACKGLGHLFFAARSVAGEAVDFDPEPAQMICRLCPVLVECRAWAIGAGEIDPDGRAVHGVVAGVAPRVRTKSDRPSMRACDWPSCRRLFVGEAHRLYCSDECRLAARAATRRVDRERRRWAS